MTPDTVSKNIDPDEVIEKTVNESGQVYLGRDLGGQKVIIAYEVVGKGLARPEFQICPECNELESES